MVMFLCEETIGWVNMDHVAIMNKKWRLIEKILSGEKTIESRWYKARFAPWGRIKSGDTVYFKNSGEKVIAKASVKKVLQFDNLTLAKVKRIIKEYGKGICLQNKNVSEWVAGKKYCILIFLEKPQRLARPFAINKSGFGNAAAWLCTDEIERIRLNE